MTNVTNPYAASDVTFSVKKEKVVSLLEWEKSLSSFDIRASVKEVQRALNAWNYQEEDSS